MNTNQIQLKASPRQPGKRISRKMRSDKFIPSVVYGPQVKNTYFAITELDATRYSTRAFENSIFILKSNDKKLNGIRVLKKEVSTHPLNGRPIHIDFYAPNMSETVKVNLEIKYTGKSEGEKNGGIFQALRRDVEVECLPTNIPDFINFDITNMNLGDVVHTSALDIPEEVKLITSEGEAIASIVSAKEEKVTPEEDTSVEAGVGEGAPTTTEAKEDSNKSSDQERK